MQSPRNPYIRTSSEPELTPSVVSYVDILGYREMAMKAESEKREGEFLKKIHRAFTEGQKFLKGDFGPKIGIRDRYVIKAFTDNVVLGYPLNLMKGFREGELELWEVFEMLSFFQIRMSNGGFFIRGAISVGELYIDDVIVLGKGLTEAYQGESEIARDPRIILTASATAAVKKQLETYKEERDTPHHRYLYRDSDGQLFLNYLEGILVAESEAGPFYSELETHRQMIEQRLTEFTTRPTIWSKYLWAANYHNFFCSQYPKYFDHSHMVDVEKFQLRPTTIF